MSVKLTLDLDPILAVEVLNFISAKNSQEAAPLEVIPAYPQNQIPISAPQIPVQQPVVPIQQTAPQQTYQTPVQQVPTQTAPTTSIAYTLEQIAIAATSLMDSGRHSDLVALLGRFGVQALTQLPKDQYGALATELRQLGAKI